MLNLSDKENRVPFLSSSSRSQNVEKSSTPGPGTYYYNNIDTKIGPIISETSERFPMPVKQIRPLTLEHIISTNDKFKYNQSKIIASRKQLDITKKILRIQSTPSIPSSDVHTGLLSSPNGVALFKDVEKENPKKNGISQFKNMQSCQPYKNATVLYKGIHIGRCKRFRDATNDKSTFPGPSDYNLLDEHKKYYQGCSFGVKLNNEFDINKDNPGPGEYEISEKKKEANRIENLAFLSTKERFNDRNDTKINDESILVITANQQNHNSWDNLQKPPFGTSAERFQKQTKDIYPSPSTYHPVSGVVSKWNPYSTAAFGSSDFKSASHWNDPAAAEDLPGPAHYQMLEKDVDRRGELGRRGTWIFNSRSKRLLPMEASLDTPSPGWYDTENKAWRRVQTVHFGRPKKCPASIISLNNLYPVSSDWFSKRKGVVVDEVKDVECGSRGVQFGKEERFKSPREDIFPGPASYYLSPLLLDTVLKPTFNVKLQ